MGFARDDIDALMPMNLQLDAAGRIVHAGPTMAKIVPKGGLHGRSVFDLFEFKRPGALSGMTGLRSAVGSPLRLSFRAPPNIALRGVAAAADNGGLLLNLGFGISVLEAIRHFDLHAGDFATTDPTLEMLYLIEAGSAAMEQTRDLNRRLQGAKIAAEEQAFTDTLTGLKNRRAMDHVIQRSKEQDAVFTLLAVDLDNFKVVNDTYGHAAGDIVLQHAARIMVSLTDPNDIIVRSGGDEFLIVLAGASECRIGFKVAERLIRKFEEPIRYQNEIYNISASIGICSTTQYADWDFDAMLRDVDTALYVAKRSGKGRASCFNNCGAAQTKCEFAETSSAGVRSGS